jgi:hypothetical protein
MKRLAAVWAAWLRLAMPNRSERTEYPLTAVNV